MATPERSRLGFKSEADVIFNITDVSMLTCLELMQLILIEVVQVVPVVQILSRASYGSDLGLPCISGGFHCPA